MLLELKQVVAGYLPGVDVLRGVDLHVSEGEIVCLIGPNGAGKSTVLRTISGLLAPTSGEIFLDGQLLNGLRPDLILRRGVAHVPQGHSSFPEMTVRENLLMGAYTLRKRRERRRRMHQVFELFPLLGERRDEKAGNFSGGEQKMLEIGRALMMEPRLMLLDEPSLGLAPKIAKFVFGIIEKLRQESGVTLLLVEQNARSGLGISDRGCVLELGEARIEGQADRLLGDPRIAQLYLGGTIQPSENSKEIVQPVGGVH